MDGYSIKKPPIFYALPCKITLNIKYVCNNFLGFSTWRYKKKTSKAVHDVITEALIFEMSCQDVYV